MFLRYETLSQHPKVFRAMTGLSVSEFDRLMVELTDDLVEADRKRLERSDRQRAMGAGRPPALDRRNQVLLGLVWLRQYPTWLVLGYFFGVDLSTASRTVGRVLPVLEAAGRATFRWPECKQGRSLPEILSDCPEVAVIVDTFEQRIQRPKQREEAAGYYSGKKKQHTLKSQICTDFSGYICHVAGSQPGPMADITLLKHSGVLPGLPAGVGMWGDLAYVGVAKAHPQGLGATPRRKPRGKPRPPEDRAYNTAFARERVAVEHGIAHLRQFDSLADTFRHRPSGHTACVVAVAGLVNRRRNWRTH